MKHNQKIGKFGEKLAKNYLIRLGYVIVDYNIKISYQEIDIIAKKDGIYIFVEVKSRMSLKYGQADEAMTKYKLNNLIKAAEYYINNKNISANYIRIDLIAIDIDKLNKKANLKHYKDII